MRIDVLVLDGVFDIGLSAVLDTLVTAQELATQLPAPRPRFVVRRVGMRRRVHTAQGLSVPVEAATEGKRAPVVIVPALGCKTPETIAAALERKEVAEACAWLRSGAERRLTLAACTGTFVLAQSGLLDGGTATTTWWLAPLFRQRFERVRLDDSAMVVESGRCVTAGAALAHLDLVLWLIRTKSPTLASLASRYLLLEEARATPALYAIPSQLAHSDPVVESFEGWARRHMATQFSLADAAKSIGTSPRTLTRRIQRTLGKTPLGYVQDLRVDRAVHRLRTSDESVDAIAVEVGYADGVTLRTLLRKKTGRTVRELRRSPQ